MSVGVPLWAVLCSAQCAYLRPLKNPWKQGTGVMHNNHRSPWVVIPAAICLLAAGSSPRASDDAEREEQAFKAGVEAYVYGYPLVLMDVTKRVMTNIPSPMPDGGSRQSVRTRTELPRRRLQERGEPQRRHTLLARLARCLEGAHRPPRPQHERALLPDADARRLDQRLRLAGETNDRHGGRRLRRRRTRMARRVARMV